MHQEEEAASQQTSGRMALLSSECVDAIMCFSCASVMLKEPAQMGLKSNVRSEGEIVCFCFK